MSKQKISRLWVIRKLCQRHYRTAHPTAFQINNVIHKYGLNKYSADGKVRSKEVLTKNIAKAYAKLKK